jgi:survival-of-motor-neuron-related-splicing factor 30
METEDQLEERLRNFREKYQIVEKALIASPTNESLQKAKKELLEVITMTEDVLKMRRKSQSNILTLPSETILNHQPETEIPPIKKTPKSNVNQSSDFYIGNHCIAIFRDDGQWYEAKIEALPSESNPNYSVTYIGYGNQAEVSPSEIAPLSEKDKKVKKKVAQNTTQNNKVVEEDENGLIVIPKSLKILPTDSEEVRNMKKRKIHAIKSQNRLKKLDEDRNSRQNAWKDFTDKFSKKTKTSSAKKDSIFRSPEATDGKVGVVGSGQGMTPSPLFDGKSVAVTKKKIPSLGPL